MIDAYDKYGNKKVKTTEFIISGSVSAPTSAEFAAEVSTRSVADINLSTRIDVVSALVGGGGSVTSAEHLSLVNRVSGNSSQMSSADASLASAINIVSVAAASKNPIITVIDEGVTVLSAPTAFDFVGAGVEVSISGAKVIVSIAAGGGGGSVTSAEYISLVDRVSANSAALTSIDNRVTSVMSAVSVESAARAAADISIMSAVSVESAARAAADTSLDLRITSVMSAVSVESAARAAADTSLDGRITSAMTAVSAKNPTITIMDEGVTILSSPSSFDFVGAGVQVSISGTKAIISIATGGGGSVTSTEYLSLVDRVSTNSAQMTSADDANSAAIVSVNNRVSALSSDVTSLKDRVSGNSTAHTSLASVVSTLQWQAVESVTGDNYTLSAGDNLKTKYFTNSTSAIGVNIPEGLQSGFQVMIFRDANSRSVTFSTQSAATLESQSVTLPDPKTAAMLIHRGGDDYIGIGAFLAVSGGGGGSVTSAEYLSLVDRVSTISAALTSIDNRVTSVMSAVSVESAARAAADISIMSAVSVESAARAAADTSLDGRITSVMSAVSAESAARAAADTSLDGRITSVMSAVSVESAARAAQGISIMSAVSVESAARAAADTSLDGRITSVMSAVSSESAARAAADTSLDGRITSVMSAVSVESAARAAADTSLDGRITSVNTAVQANSADFTSFKQSIDNIGDVSATGATSGQVLTFISGQWIANSVPTTVGSVTSAEFAALASTVSAGGGLLHMVADLQGISATGLTDISGLSITFATNGSYQIHAHVMYSVSGAGNTRFGISTPGATHTHGMILGDVSGATPGGVPFSSARGAGGFFNFTSAGNSVIFSTASAVTTGDVHGVIMEALVVSATAGSFKLMAAVSATTVPMTIIPGSFIRAYRIG